jgi:hypothetical protein
MEDTIAEAMGRALFVCAYADAIEAGEIEGDKAGTGQDWMDVAPATPRRFLNDGWRLLGKFEQLNGMHIACLWAAACRADGVDSAEPPSEHVDKFGHYLAMQALGHGVSWFDDHERFDLKCPRVESYVDQNDMADWPTQP